MNREEATELLPVIKAFAEGKIIQFKYTDEARWKDLNDNAGFISGCEYRIKPGPRKVLIAENEVGELRVVRQDDPRWKNEKFYGPFELKN